MSKIDLNTTALQALLAKAEALPDASAGYEEGQQAAYDAFWDSFQDEGARFNYNHGFYNWTEDCFRPKYPLATKWGGSATYMLAYSLVEDTKVDITFGSGTNALQTFYSATKLHTIHKLIVLAATTYDKTFHNCPALVNLTVEGVIGQNGFDLQNSTVLSKASIESVVSALSQDTSGLSITFSLAAVNTAFETASGTADGSTSEAWLNLIATRSNWTISLV